MVESMMALDPSTHGDERERRVLVEAGNVGFMVSLVCAMGAAIVAGAMGSVLLAVSFTVLASLPSWSAAWYARRHRVDIERVMGRDRGAYVVRQVVHALAALACCGTLAYLAVTGEPLVPWAGEFAPTGRPDGALLFGVSGAAVFIVIGVVWSLAAQRRPGRPRGLDGDEPDDAF